MFAALTSWQEAFSSSSSSRTSSAPMASNGAACVVEAVGLVHVWQGLFVFFVFKDAMFRAAAALCGEPDQVERDEVHVSCYVRFVSFFFVPYQV